MKDKDNEAALTENKKALSRLLSNDRILSIIVMLGIAGIALIFISSYLSPVSSDSETNTEEISDTDTFSENYKNELTEELGNMIARIDGAGRTKVMITLEGTVRDVYAADTDTNGKESSRKTDSNENADKQNTEKKTYTIIRGRDGSEKALSIGQLLPEIKGVLVVCDGGDREDVKEKIIQAVSAALNITRSHIYVTALQK